jgi:hypothetical protein
MTISPDEVLARGEALYRCCATADNLPGLCSPRLQHAALRSSATIGCCLTRAEDLRDLIGEHARPARRRTTSVSGMVLSLTLPDNDT